MPRLHRNPSIARLLGPAGPEILCDECFEQLDVYVDAELGHADPDAAVPGMRAHLEGCPACSEEYESLRALVRQDARPGEPRRH
jgi:anti-sigma factor RsiW